MKNCHWWKDKSSAWNRIAKNFWPDCYRKGNVEVSTTDAGMAWAMFERIAFLYEIAARKDWEKSPKWLFGVPFDELDSGQLIYLKDFINWSGKTPSKPRGGVTISRGSPSDSHAEGEINLGKLFAGVFIRPSRNSKAVTTAFLISEVEKYMKANSLTFSKPREGQQHKPLEWSQLELIDKLHARKGKIEDYDRAPKRAIFSRYQRELANLHRV